MHSAYLITDEVNVGKISGSDQDSVRLLAVEVSASLGKLLEPEDCASQILPIIVGFSQVTFSYTVISIMILFLLIFYYKSLHFLSFELSTEYNLLVVWVDFKKRQGEPCVDHLEFLFFYYLNS